MKLNYLIIVFITLLSTACNIYTVHNLADEDIQAGAVLVKSQECAELVDFFGIVGDFPLIFLNSQGDKIDSVSYEPAHYRLQSMVTDPKMGADNPTGIEVISVKDPCKRDL